MTIETYLILFVAGLLGISLQVVLKLRSLKIKASLANVIFNPGKALLDDWLSIVASLLTILICLLCIDNFISYSPVIEKYLKFGMVFVGYTGSDIISRFFSVANSTINKAIDYKTTIADTATGTLDKPTPTTK